MNSQLEKDIRNRIMMINEDLRQNLMSIELEDAMDEEELRMFEETEALTAELIENSSQISILLKSLRTEVESSLTISDEKIALKVKKEDAVTELNAEEGTLVFKTKLFEVDTPNFKVNASGCYVNGTVYSGSADIAGWKFANNKADGGSSAVLSGGEIYANAANCKYVNAKNFYLNAAPVNISNSYWQVGSMNGRRSRLNGTMQMIYYGEQHFNGHLNSPTGDIFCCKLRLSYDGNNKKDRNIIECNLMQAGNSYYGSSDARLKENIRDITESQAAALGKLRPVGYTLKKTGQRAAGLIAQEVLQLESEIGSDALVGEHKGYYTLCYTQLIPLMIKQIQINQKKLERIGK